MRERREGRAPLGCNFSFVFLLFLFLLVRNLPGALLSFVFPMFFLLVVGGPTMTG